MTKLKLLLAAAVFCGGLATVSASAMPVANLAQHLATNVESVRWVCGPYRCWWRPGPRYWGPRFYGRRWGYGPRWRYRRHWGY